MQAVITWGEIHLPPEQRVALSTRAPKPGTVLTTRHWRGRTRDMSDWQGCLRKMHTELAETVRYTVFPDKGALPE